MSWNVRGFSFCRFRVDKMKSWSPFGIVVSSLSLFVALGMTILVVKVLSLFDWNVL